MGAARKGAYEVTTRKIVRPVSERKDTETRALDRALEHADKMDPDAYARTVFSIKGAERIQVSRVMPDGREVSVGFLTPDTLDVGDSITDYLLSQFGGPGAWVLKPARPAKVGGFICYGKYKRVTAGVSALSDGGMARGSLDDVDRTLADRTKRLAALEATQIMERAVKANQGGEEGMKAEDFKTIAEAMALVRGNGGASETVLLKIVDRLDGLEKKIDRPAWESLIASLTPILTPLLATIKPGTLAQYAAIAKGWMAAPVTMAPERPWWEGLAALVKEALASPALQPLVMKLMETAERGQPAPRQALPAGQPGQEVKPIMAVREFTDPDAQEAVHSIVAYLEQRKFAEASAVMRQVPEFMSWVFGVRPDVEPPAYWFGLKALDKRLSEMKATALEFIEYVQEENQRLIEAAEKQAQEEAEAASKGGEDHGGKESA